MHFCVPKQQHLRHDMLPMLVKLSSCFVQQSQCIYVLQRNKITSIMIFLVIPQKPNDMSLTLLMLMVHPHHHRPIDLS